MKTIVVLAATCAILLPSQAAVKLGMPFVDHMVLQREKPVAVWGTADPGEKVTVSFAGKTAETQANASGDWRVDIGPFAASKEGRTLKANGVEVKDVLVGEVWFAGGQSNMGVPLVWVDPRHGDEKGAMIAQYVRRPYVRFARHSASWQAKPVRTGSVEWKELPFYFAQVAPWGSADVPALQEAQAQFAAEQPNAAIAIINDLGNTVDIHPNRKQAVAQRLALHAFKRLYGYTHIQDNSPTLKDWRIEGDKFILSFRDVKRFYVYNMDRSLKTGFEICGADGAWKPADIQNFRVTKGRKGGERRQGELVGTEVVVSSKDVPKPVRLRYLHSAPWFGALYNEVNLPVGAFHVGKEGN